MQSVDDRFSVAGLTEGWRVSLSSSQQDGVEYVQVVLEADAPMRPPQMAVEWRVPVIDIQGTWYPGIDWAREMTQNWSKGVMSRATTQAPVFSLYNMAGENRHTFAVSDGLNPLRLTGGVKEETAEIVCRVAFFVEPAHPMTRYEATIRIDTRPLPYYEVLAGVQCWWAAQPGYEPAAVPEIARLPMYSTWYSFHQSLEPDTIVNQCRIAKSMGCEAVIVDDGWQTLDSRRGYAYCGDWEPERIPDMRGFVDRVHAEGMKFLLWYAVPFIGPKAKNYERFLGKYMAYYEGGSDTWMVDPRFPEVREFLITTYEKALREWNLDGFKLDFVNSFLADEEHAYQFGNGRDYDSVPEAVDRLLTDVMSRLRAIKPDIMIEFRQMYIGPLMRKYGNMFRAGDCPNDCVGNRLRTIDVRLLCGNTAAHADMFMFHPDDSVECAALQFIHTLFAVPQVSLLLDRISPRHQAMVRFWLSFWRSHRDVLLDGKLTPFNPQAGYPLIIASTPAKRIAAVYGDVVVNPGINLPDEWYVVNGSHGNRVVLELDEAQGERTIEVRDCTGKVVRSGRITMAAGVMAIQVPASGVAKVSR